SLRKRYDIEYVELVGRKHAEVLAEIQQCDFVVDQLNGEGPCGGLATEAAALGKPAVVGTHTDDIWRMFAPDELPPVMRCENDKVEEAIETLIVDRELRVDLGRRACEFVRRYWDAGEVARRFLRVASGDVPPEWMYDPRALRYVYGAGFTPRELRETLGRYLALGGVEALQLADKPQLASDLVAYAGGEAA
ncbi:MAG TPA: glycosyltransferase, partial [Thermoanaerobaculia bacterium]|nr:glycosyltransferase [Thermoanaerobaculia bacterium]